MREKEYLSAMVAGDQVLIDGSIDGGIEGDVVFAMELLVVL